MAFHKSNLGSNGLRIASDLHGFVATADTDAWELEFDHGGESTHDAAGELTEYGEWFEDEAFPRIKAQAIQETIAAENDLRRQMHDARRASVGLDRASKEEGE